MLRMTLDNRIGRKPIRKDFEVPGIFCENACVPNIAPPLLSDLAELVECGSYLPVIPKSRTTSGG